MDEVGLDPLNLDSLDSLREIPGVGEKIAGRMEDFFGSEEGALGRIREGDVASLSTVPGLTEAKDSLSLNPSEKTSKPESKFDLDLEDYPNARSLVNMIRACYMQGGEEIRVFSSKGTIVEEKESLRAVPSDLIGGEVVLDRPDEFAIQVLVDPTRFTISNILFRISDLISSMQKDSIEALRSASATLASDASDRGGEINRLYRLMIRQLEISAEDKTVADSIGIKNRLETIHYAIAARDLSRMGYHIVKVAKRVGNLKTEIKPEIMDLIVDLSDTVSDMREKAVKSLLSNDYKLANEVFTNMDKVKKLDQHTTQYLLDKSIKPENSNKLISLTSSLRRAAGHTVAIGDVATNKAALLKRNGSIRK
ncbi:hypothetical protein AKJ39_05235 [candidate division MSBL1 archaeon SCGC-AAA259J03]|uniref:PhoU domain-containing protein n=1 Tax=candidate division MSBL1 archaeon SCGC-AAA259J03 TaxID=1698269 RepID=A0A656YUG0_9EURY|nr:hypothetical protein AKJ39_05235 [candidate division MSBL1 archaeon SCGC-AAA259J03]